jgi:hypothetical protein
MAGIQYWEESRKCTSNYFGRDKKCIQLVV